MASSFIGVNLEKEKELLDLSMLTLKNISNCFRNNLALNLIVKMTEIRNKIVTVSKKDDLSALQQEYKKLITQINAQINADNLDKLQLQVNNCIGKKLTVYSTVERETELEAGLVEMQDHMLELRKTHKAYNDETLAVNRDFAEAFGAFAEAATPESASPPYGSASPGFYKSLPAAAPTNETKPAVCCTIQ